MRLGPIPIDVTRHIVDFLKLITDFDDRKTNHSRVERQSAANGGLDGP